MPDVTGQDKDDAKKALEAKGFEVDTNTVDGGGQKDTVLSTDPAAGTQAQPGSKVTMNVSKGNQQNQVPNVVGQTLASAAQNLAAAGYTNLAVTGFGGIRTASSPTRTPATATPTPTSGSC